MQVAITENILAFLAVSDAESAGRLVGQWLVPILLLLGIVKCVKLMRRPATEGVCVCALMVLLTAWCGFVSTNLLGKHLEWPLPVHLVLMLLWLLLSLGALTLGIIGLARFDRSRFVQGRSQAIWAIVLGILASLAFLGGLGRLSQGYSGKGLGGSAPKRETVPEFNCSVAAPAKWVNVDPKKLGSEAAQVGFRRLNPELYMLLVSAELGESTDFEAYVGAVKSNLSTGSDIATQTEETVSLGGLEFRRLMTSGTMPQPKMELYYEHWLVTKGGMFWQITVWGSLKQRAAVEKEARRFAEEFRVLDASRKVAEKGTLKDMARPDLGLTTRMEGSGWRPGGAEFSEYALIAFSAKRTFEALLVLPIRFDDTSPDLESITRAMLATMEFNDAARAEMSERRFTSEAGEGIELTAERKINDGHSAEYILRVVRGEKHAHFVAGWATKPSGDLERVRRAMDAIQLRPPMGNPTSLSPAQTKALGFVLNHAGISYFVRTEYGAAAPLFERAFHLDSDPTYLENLASSLQSAGKLKEALAVIERDEARFPKAWDVQVRRASLLALNGDPEKGSTHFLTMLDRGLKDEAQLLAWVNTLVGLKRHDLAEKAVVTWNAKQGSLKTRRWLAETIAESGDAKRAVAIIEKLAEENSSDDATVCKLGELLNAAEDYSRAQEVAEKLLANGKDNPRALQVLGWSQMGRRWFREARESFEKAGRIRPQDDGIKEAIKQASAALGQGDNSDLKQPITPVPIPPAVERELTAADPSNKIGQGHPAITLRISTGYDFREGEPLRRTFRRRVQILNQAGVNLFSTLEYPFDPSSERIFVNRLEVLEGDGKVVATGSVDDTFVRDASDGTASHRKVLNITVPGLRPGRILDVEVTTQNRGLERDFPFTRHLFAYRLPATVEAVFVTGDTGRIKNVTARADVIKTVSDHRVAAWFVRGQAPLEDEPFSTPVETRAPALWLGGGSDSWKEVARQYLKDIADRLALDAEAGQRSAELCKGLTTEREKIAAIVREVQMAIGYKAIEFGIRARRPNAASETLRQRFGDCKDQALLLHQMLRAAKIESHLVLVHTDREIQSALPSLDQFNHMVVHLPALGKGWLIDTTNKQLALSDFPSLGLWDAQALLLDPKGPSLFKPINSVPEGSANVDSKRKVTLDGDSWTVKETLTLTGYYAAAARATYAEQTATEQSRRAQAFLSALGSAQLKDFAFANLDEVAAPARLSLTYSVPGAVATEGGQALARLPSFWEREYLALAYVQNRVSPFRFRYPFRFWSTLEIQLPPSASVAALTQKGSGKYARWEMEGRAGANGSWAVTSQFRSAPSAGTPSEYQGLYEEWEKARSLWNRAITWPANAAASSK